MWWAVAEAASALPIPAHLTIDGDLREWRSAPSFSSPRVWMAAGPAGFAIAGDVDDTTAVLTGLSPDHAEIWLSLPPADLPPVGFGNQFGETRVLTPDDCADIEDEDGCRGWWASQAERRRLLVSVFTRRYTEKPGTWSVKTRPGGWSFEAWVPLADLPATTAWPITSARVLVEILDHDPAVPAMSTGGRPSDPSTFTAFVLSPPIALPGDPILENLATKAGVRAHLFRRPGQRGLYHWGNLMQGYQYSPGQPSPTETRIDTTPKRLFRWRGLEVARAPLGLPNIANLGASMGIAVLRDGRLYGQYFADNVTDRVETPSRLLISVRTLGTVSPLGAGACGACPSLDLAVLALTPEGRLSVAWEWSASADGAVPTVDATLAPNGATLRVHGWRDGEGHADPIDTTLSWDEATATFIAPP